MSNKQQTKGLTLPEKDFERDSWYQTMASRTITPDGYALEICHCTIGINTEWLELFLALNSKGRIDQINVKEEIGDILWYMANVHRITGLTFGWANIPKQKARFALDELSFAIAELGDAFKRHVIYKVELDTDRVIKNGNALAFLLAEIAGMYGFTIWDCMEANIEKLFKRYPNKFNYEDAVNRDLETERIALGDKPEPSEGIN